VHIFGYRCKPFTEISNISNVPKVFIYQLMYKTVDLKRVLKFTLKHATCFGAITIIRKRIFGLVKVTVVKIIN